MDSEVVMPLAELVDLRGQLAAAQAVACLRLCDERVRMHEPQRCPECERLRGALAEAEDCIAQLYEQLAEAQRLLHDLTPGGSEFVSNPQNCARWVRERLDCSQHVAVEASRQANAGIRELHDVEQTLGAALGYPRYCDDRVNFPAATEVDGVCVGDHSAASLAAEAATRLAEVRAALAEHREAVECLRDCIAARLGWISLVEFVRRWFPRHGRLVGWDNWQAITANAANDLLAAGQPAGEAGQ